MFKRFQPLFAALIATCVVVGSATAANDVQSERVRHADNTARIAKLHPWMQPKVEAEIKDLESHGWRPVIDGLVYRSPSQQASLVKKGNSWVSYSFHMVTDRDKNGKAIPASLAADIYDKRYGYNSGNQYWLMQASAAQAHGLATGIRWGLPTADRIVIDKLIAAKNWTGKYRRGIDPAHSEPNGKVITLDQARKGKRPHVIRSNLR